jgi:hypothetical protein
MTSILSSIKMSPLIFYAISAFLIAGMIACCLMDDSKKRTGVTNVTHRYPTRFQAKKQVYACE